MSNVLSNTAAFIFALGVIIFVHEAGHLLVAKIFGVRVLTFSLGFGPRIWGFRRDKTDYRISLVPLGGYVRLGGEDPTEVTDDPREFLNKPRWQRILIYLAGPAMNVVLAVVLIAVVLMVGIEVSSLPELPPVIGNVAEGSAAEKAGLRAGDRVVEIEGRPVDKWDEVQFSFLTSPDRPVPVTLLRDGERITTVVTPVKVPKYEFGDAGVFPTVLPRIAQVIPESPAQEAGFQPGDEILGVDGRTLAKWEDFVAYIQGHPEQAVAVDVLRGAEPVTLTVVPRLEDGKGKIGLRPGYFQRYGPWEALVRSCEFNYDSARQTLIVLGKILTGKLAAKSFSGESSST